MEKIFILGSNESLQQLGFHYIEIPVLTNDSEIHNWIISVFSNTDINKILIEIGDRPKLSIKIALHIRLSLEELKEKSLLPILFISNKTIDAVILETAIWSHLFATNGIYFSIFDNVQNLKAEAQVIEGISPDEYKTCFLDIIKILPNENIGRHSLANIWGAYVMAKAANIDVFDDYAEFQKSRTGLYFKYMSAFNFKLSRLKPSPLKVIGQIRLGKTNRIESTGKKILLIDDEADKGWELVLRDIFKSAVFLVINEKVQDYNSFSDRNKEIIEKNSFDLYLVDLRLNGTAEEKTLQTSDFSGMKVLQKIKSLNKGNQVIIFTASNKVWNQKALLEAGADGYYMKESPEYNFSNEFSLQNYNIFKNEVELTFGLSYLRDVFVIDEKCRTFINIDKANKTGSYKRFYERTFSQLEIAFELLKQSNNIKYLNLSYLSYYQILEDYVKLPENFQHETHVACFVNGNKVIDIINKEWQLKFVDKTTSSESFSYYEISIESREDENPLALAKISFILAYKFNKDNKCLREWGRLNNLRNTVAVHGGKSSTVTIKDLKSLLSIVELFLTNP